MERDDFGFDRFDSSIPAGEFLRYYWHPIAGTSSSASFGSRWFIDSMGRYLFI